MGYYLFMPTVLTVNGLRFFFWSRENSEPPHIHVEQADNFAKFWLEPVSLAKSRGFRNSELSQVQALVEQHKALFLEKWYEHFDERYAPSSGD